MIVKGITIHNTGNGRSARQLYDILIAQRTPYLCHFLVDENEIIQTISLDDNAEHTGKGYDYGNMNTIAIEICRSTSDEKTYLKAQSNAIALVKELMREYNLTVDNVYFHIDFNPMTYCPHRILDMYGNKKNFIEEVF